ncbi:MAG: response regulator [Boseongicola sp.]|nr:response regulator [Boseongicola sp.]
MKALSDKSILYVEDDNIVAIETEEALRDLGFGQVFSAQTLTRALELVSRFSFDFAMLDYDLGNGERSTLVGLELEQRGVPTVFLSGYHKSELEAAVQRFEFLEKPVLLTCVRRKITDLLRITSTEIQQARKEKRAPKDPQFLSTSKGRS